MSSHRAELRSDVRRLVDLLDDAKRADQLMNPRGTENVTAMRSTLKKRYAEIVSRAKQAVRASPRMTKNTLGQGERRVLSELLQVLKEQRRMISTIRPNDGLLEHFCRELMRTNIMYTEVFPSVLEQRIRPPIPLSLSHESMIPDAKQLLRTLAGTISKLARSEPMVHSLDDTQKKVAQLCETLLKNCEQVAFEEPADGAYRERMALYHLAQPLLTLVTEIQTTLVHLEEWNPVRLGIFVDSLKSMLRHHL
ncbi:MAG: hypothetical protein ABIG34_03625 [Candidatus Peregrinibacteria bacterium]